MPTETGLLDATVLSFADLRDHFVADYPDGMPSEPT
jgi:hypothetical protein